MENWILMPTIYEFLEQLLDLQLLISDISLNIIGQDYFKRIGYSPQKKIGSYLITERKFLSGQLSSRDLENIKESINFLSKLIPEQKNTLLEDFKKSFISRFENKYYLFRWCWTLKLV